MSSVEMKDQLQQRLEALKAEFESGQKMLAETDAKQATLRETLLRIAGAIQVLEEELAKEAPAPDGAEQPEAAAKDASVRD